MERNIKFSSVAIQNRKLLLKDFKSGNIAIFNNKYYFILNGYFDDLDDSFWIIYYDFEHREESDWWIPGSLIEANKFYGQFGFI